MLSASDRLGLFDFFWGKRFADGIGEILCGDDYFSVQIDVGYFRPEELKVTVIEKEIVVEGKHNERTDIYGQVERYFVRRFPLPSGVEPEQVNSELSREGILTIRSAREPPALDDQIHNIPIKR